MRYWYHPESESLWFTETQDEKEHDADGLIEEVSKERYDKIFEDHRKIHQEQMQYARGY